MLPEKRNLQTNETEFRDIGGAEGLLKAYQQGERDFSQVNLENADLRKANLVGINFEGANLKGANLERADLQRANLSSSNLSDANLTEAKLDISNLKSAVLERANLTYAYMACCELIEANLTEAILISAELTAANLEKCILDKANLTQARLRKVQLQRATLIQAYLQEGKLQLANLTDANLQKADLSKAELEGAALERTDLRGAEISTAKNINLEFAILGELNTVIKQSLHLEIKESRPSFSFSPDGEMLAYLNKSDDKVTIINPNTSKTIQVIDIQSEPVVSIAFCEDEENFYKSFYVNELKLWNPLTGELIKSLKNHSANYTAIIVDSNNKQIAMTGTGEPFELFDIGHETRTLKGYSTGILTQAHSPDGKITARSGPDLDGQIELLERPTGKRICLLRGHEAAVQSLSFSPDSEMLASKSAKDFKVWQISTKKQIYCMLGSPRREIDQFIAFTQIDNISHSVLISNDFWDQFGCQHRPNKLSKEDRKGWNYSGNSSSSRSANIILSANGKTMVRRCYGLPIQLWNIQTGEELGTVNLTPLALSSTGDIFAAWYGTKIALVDVKTNKIILTFAPNLDGIKQVVFSPDDKILACVSDSCKIMLWNLETNCEIQTLTEYSQFKSIAFSPSEPILASGCDDGKITLWDLETFEEIHSFKSSSVNLKFSPDGKFLVSSSKDTIYLWKLTRSS